MKRILRYWPEFLVFGACAAVFIICLAPSLTWMNMAVDGTAYVMSAKWLYPAHHTSAPLYLLVGHLFTLILLGTDYWRLGLLSVVSALVAMVFIYLIVMKLLPGNKKARWYALVGSGLFGSSMMLISQATIVEPFTLVTALGAGAYYFTLKKNWVMTSVMLGAGLAVHHLILITWLVLLIFHKDLRKWKPILISLSFGLFYLYIPLSKALTDAPVMWMNTGFKDFFINAYSTFVGLAAGLSIYDAPKRLIETVGFLGLSFTIGFVVLCWFVWKVKFWTKPLFWLFTLPVIYAASDLDPHVSRYALPGYAFAGIIIALGLSKLKPVWLYSTGLASIAMLGINGNYFDIGRTLDPNLTATKFYTEEYPKVQDGQIMMNFLPGGEWEMAFYYNKKEDKHIIPVCIGMLTNPAYQDLLKSQGVQFTTNDKPNQTDNEMDVALSITRLNKDVLITIPTTLNDYGATLVPALGNEQEMTKFQNYKIVPQWKFLPSNPYHILTGALDTSDWQWTLKSTWDVKLVAGCLLLGMILNWFMSGMPRRRKIEVEDEANIPAA